jgi:hypothetical protein
MRAVRWEISTIKGQINRITAIVVIFMLVTSAAPAQGQTRHAELPKFYKINERLYGGGQPVKRNIQ